MARLRVDACSIRYIWEKPQMTTIEKRVKQVAEEYKLMKGQQLSGWVRYTIDLTQLTMLIQDVIDNPNKFGKIVADDPK